MQCPSCQVEFHDRRDEWEQASKPVPDTPVSQIVSITLCPKCKMPIVEHSVYIEDIDDIVGHEIIYPLASKQVKVDSAVPEVLKNDYVEAVLVLDISAKASAALSRRILQSILNEQGYLGRDLAKQVDAVLNESNAAKVLPLYVRDKIDVIRNFGNFSAHPVTDTTTLQIIDVEPEEAEWCLEIVSDLFEHYYVRPAADARKLADLNQKLQQAGKPMVK